MQRRTVPWSQGWCVAASTAELPVPPWLRLPGHGENEPGILGNVYETLGNVPGILVNMLRILVTVLRILGNVPGILGTFLRFLVNMVRILVNVPRILGNILRILVNVPRILAIRWCRVCSDGCAGVASSIEGMGSGSVWGEIWFVPWQNRISVPGLGWAGSKGAVTIPHVPEDQSLSLAVQGDP